LTFDIIFNGKTSSKVTLCMIANTAFGTFDEWIYYKL